VYTCSHSSCTARQLCVHMFTLIMYCAAVVCTHVHTHPACAAVVCTHVHNHSVLRGSCVYTCSQSSCTARQLCVHMFTLILYCAPLYHHITCSPLISHLATYCLRKRFPDCPRQCIYNNMYIMFNNHSKVILVCQKCVCVSVCLSVCLYV
jgi:hypothetical protein